MRQRQQREAATRPKGKRERQPKSSSAYSDWWPLLLLLGFLELILRALGCQSAAKSAPRSPGRRSRCF